MNAWYVRLRGQVSGPYTLDQLRLQRKSGQFGRFHEISEDRETWKRATSLRDLFPETRDSSTGDAGGSRTDSTGELKAEPRPLPGATELPQQPTRPGAKANAGHGTPPPQLTQASWVNRSRAFWVASVGAAAALLGLVVAVVVGWGVWSGRGDKGKRARNQVDTPVFAAPTLYEPKPGAVLANGPPSVEDASAEETQPQQQFTNSIGMNLMQIPAGEFMMGSPDLEPGQRKGEKPQHRVRITKPFYMGIYEVTQAEYTQVMGRNPSSFSSSGPRKDRVAGMDTSRFPVEMVSWEDADQFRQRLSSRPEERQAGRIYRLPTEAEWEYACRARTTTPFHFGNVASSKHANFNPKFPNGGSSEGPYLDRPTKVGSYAPNAWGLYDMHGNVAEWCSDRYDENYYKQRVEVDPQGPPKGADDRHVLRGGAWLFFGLDCRSACRERFENQTQIHDIIYGFRVVCEKHAMIELAAAGDQTQQEQRAQRNADPERKKTETQKKQPVVEKKVQPEEPKKPEGGVRSRDKDKVSVTATFQTKRAGGIYTTKSVEITVKIQGKAEETLNVFLVQPGEKERQIGVIEPGQNEWRKEQAIKGAKGVHEVIIRNKEGKVVAERKVR